MISIKNSQQGFTLIEVLVALVVILIGIVSVISMQQLGLRHTHNAYITTVATEQMNMMAERMRANSEGVNNGDYDSYSSASTGSNPGCGTSCTPAETAQLDHYQWQLENSTRMPAGTGTITNNGDDTFTIDINWSELDKSAGADALVSKTRTGRFRP